MQQTLVTMAFNAALAAELALHGTSREVQARKRMAIGGPPRIPLSEGLGKLVRGQVTGGGEAMVLPAPWDEARPGRPLVVGHRAGGNEAPENTLAALHSAEAAGCKAWSLCFNIKIQQHHHCWLGKWRSTKASAPQIMQMDILPTREGTPVIFHDTSLLRATGVDADIRQVHIWCE